MMLNFVCCTAAISLSFSPFALIPRKRILGRPIKPEYSKCIFQILEELQRYVEGRKADFIHNVRFKSEPYHIIHEPAYEAYMKVVLYRVFLIRGLFAVGRTTWLLHAVVNCFSFFGSQSE